MSSFLAPGIRFLLQPIQLGVRADEQAPLGDCGRGPGVVVKFVLAYDVKFIAVVNDIGRAVFVEQEQLAVVGPRRRIEASAAGLEALARVDRLARLGVGTGKKSRVEENVKPLTANQV